MTFRKFAKRTVITVLVLVIAAVVLIHTSPVQQFLLRRAESLAARFGFPFDAESIHLRPFALQLSVRNFEYGRDGLRIHADFAEIDAAWSVYSASEGFVLDSVAADGVQITMVSTEPSIPEPSGEPIEAPRVRIRDLELRHGSFSYTHQSTRFEVPSFDLKARDGVGTLQLPAPLTLMMPDATIQVPEIPIEFTTGNVRLGETYWSIRYADRAASGFVQGLVEWAPALAANVTIETDPLTIDQWDGIVARGNLVYEDGVLHVRDFQAARGQGAVNGTAEVSDKGKSATLAWSDIALDPAGVRGRTAGELSIRWTASDFGDIGGSGAVTVNTAQYGQAQSNIRIDQGRAHLNIRAVAMGANVNADVVTGLDRRLSGTFRATHREFGLVTAAGRLAGTLTDPRVDATLTADDITYNGIGPLDASARAAYRADTVTLTAIMAKLKNSTIPDGAVQVHLTKRTIEGAIPVIHTQLHDFIADGSGEIIASAYVTGTIDMPLAALSASSPGLDIGGTHIDSVNAKVSLENSVVYVSQLIARQKDGVLEASGMLDIETELVEGDLSVRNLLLTQVRGLSTTVNLDGEVEGSLRTPSATFKGELTDVVYDGEDHGTVLLSGRADQQMLNARLQSAKYNASIDGALRLEEPYGFTAFAAANKTEIQYRQYAVVADGRIEAAGALEPLAVGRLAVENLTVSGEGIDLRASGALDSGIRLDVDADLAQLPVEGVQLGGTAQISALVSGSIENPQVEGTLRTTDATAQTMGMPEAATAVAAVDFTRDRFTIRDLRANYADAVVFIEGNGSLRGSGEFLFQVENIRPERLLPERPLSGLVGLEGQLVLTAPRLDAINGSARITQFELNARGVEIHQSEPGEIRLADQIVSVDRFSLEGPETNASIDGTANLMNGSLNIDVTANTNLQILEGILPQSNAQGRIESEISLRGTTSKPDMLGFVNLSNARIQVAEPALQLSGVMARIRLEGNRLEIENATGDLNNGNLSITGGAGIASAGVQDSAIQMVLKGTQLEYPEGLQSEISANLSLEGSSPLLTLSGNINVLDALYREDVNLREQVFERLTPEAAGALAEGEAPGLLQQVHLDVTVETTGPVTVANNVASLDLTGSFRIRGTAADPVILGRASALEGGEVYFGPTEGAEAAALGERADRFIIERGTVDFNNPLRTEPTVDLEATHELQARDERYLIRLRAEGTPTDLRTELTSDPHLAEPDIITMLLTGRTFAELQGAHAAVAREQVLNYLSGQLTTRFFEGAGTALGLDTVTIEPVTIASEADVSARVTVGKNITRDLSLIFSQNLAGPRDQAWILDYSTYRNFVVRGINRPDQNEIRGELRHNLEFGGGPQLPRRIAPRSDSTLNSVTFNGSTFSRKELLEHVAEPDDPYNMYRMNEDVRSLRQFFASRGYTDAKIHADRDVFDTTTNVTFTIEQGPRITFEYQGARVPEDIREEVVQVWVEGLGAASSLRESIELLLRHFRNEGYLQANVTAREESTSPESPESRESPEERLYLFQIEPGTEFDDPEWVFNGVEPLDITDDPGTIMENPEAIRERIESELRGNGFLDAKSTLPELVLENGRPRFVVTVERGVQFMVSGIGHEGNTFFSDPHLNRVVILGPTDVIPADEAGAARPPEAEKPLEPFPYTSDWVSIARRRIVSEYWQQGFNNVQIAPSTHYEPGSGKIEVRFDIREGERQQIADIRINGDEKTLRNHVQRYFKFEKGDPVDYTRINVTRKQLYDTGLFRRVEIDVVQEPEGYVAHVNLNERAPWSVRYGITVTDHRTQDKRDLGVSTELTYRNLLGKGILTGTSFRIDPTFREARLFSSLPVFFNKDVTTTANVFRTRETLADSVSNTWGFTLQQQWRLRDYYLLTYDYGYRRVGTFERDLTDDDPEILNGVIPVARFNATLSRDTRDDILNATRGTFFSNSLDLAPPGVGSSIHYIRNYAQYLRFREVLRPNLIWASAYRLGLARGFGGSQLIPTDRFSAGGATSLRAFDDDQASLEPGNALFVTNQELRYPLFWRLGVVGFFDVGNVYERLGSIQVLRQRYSPGFGLRINTPLLLLRVDLGFNLWPRTGEEGQRISFGIGQAF